MTNPKLKKAQQRRDLDGQARAGRGQLMATINNMPAVTFDIYDMTSAFRYVKYIIRDAEKTSIWLQLQIKLGKLNARLHHAPWHQKPRYWLKHLFSSSPLQICCNV